jgi:phage tail protein X
MEYLTRQNDILDDVVHRYYGDTDRLIVERVLEANRALDLGNIGPVLPAGLLLTLPDRDPDAPVETLTRLWD